MLQALRDWLFGPELPTPEVNDFMRRTEINKLLERIEIARAQCDTPVRDWRIARDRINHLGRLGQELIEMDGCRPLSYRHFLIMEIVHCGDLSDGRTYWDL